MRPCSTRDAARRRAPGPRRWRGGPRRRSRCVPASVVRAAVGRADRHPDVALAARRRASIVDAEVIAHALVRAAARWTTAARSRSSRGRIAGAMSTTVTSLPRRRNACAISLPIGPLPIDEQVRHILAQVEHRLVGEEGRLREARDRRHRRARAGGDDEVSARSAGGRRPRTRPGRRSGRRRGSRRRRGRESARGCRWARCRG